MFKNWDWGDTWLALLLSAVTTGFAILIIWACSDKSTIRYSLGQNSNTPCIVKEIDNYQDERISIDRNLSLDSVTVIISKLNNQLKK